MAKCKGIYKLQQKVTDYLILGLRIEKYERTFSQKSCMTTTMSLPAFILGVHVVSENRQSRAGKWQHRVPCTSFVVSSRCTDWIIVGRQQRYWL